MLDQEVLALDSRLGLACFELDKLVRVFIFDYRGIFRKASFGFVFNFTSFKAEVAKSPVRTIAEEVLTIGSPLLLFEPCCRVTLLNEFLI